MAQVDLECKNLILWEELSLWEGRQQGALACDYCPAELLCLLESRQRHAMHFVQDAPFIVTDVLKKKW